MFQNILQWDERLTRTLSNILPHNSFFDGFFAFLSGYGSSFVIWIGIVLLLIIFEEKRHREFIFSFFAAILSAGFLTNFVLKNLFQRPRPSLINVGSYLCPTDFSFPSGHATVAFAAAVVLSRYDSKRTKIYYTIAVLVSISRIYLGCHFFLDVVIGGIIGYLIAGVVISFLHKNR